MPIDSVHHETIYRYRQPVAFDGHRMVFLRVGRGPDATDVAISASFGASRLVRFKVFTDEVGA